MHAGMQHRDVAMQELPSLNARTGSTWALRGHAQQALRCGMLTKVQSGDMITCPADHSCAYSVRLSVQCIAVRWMALLATFSVRSEQTVGLTKSGPLICTLTVVHQLHSIHQKKLQHQQAGEVRVKLHLLGVPLSCNESWVACLASKRPECDNSSSLSTARRGGLV